MTGADDFDSIVENENPDRRGNEIVAMYQSVRQQLFQRDPWYLQFADGVYVAGLKSNCKMPLRNKKGDEMFRMVENLATVQMPGGSGHGWIEAADLIVEGIPKGNRIV